MTISEYYLKKYGLKIKYEKQPLIVVYEKKQGKHLFFVPELCVLTGIPEEMNEFQRKELINATKVNPEETFNVITSFIKRLINPNSNLSTSNIAESLGINFH